MSKFPPKLRPEIPKIPFTLRAGFMYLLKRSPRLAIDMSMAPYTHSELAWIKASKEAMARYRNNALSLMITFLTLGFFLSQSSPLISNDERSFFLAAPFNEMSFSFFWYSYLALIGLLICVILLVLLIFILSFVFIPKMAWSLLKEAEFVNSICEFDIHRTFPYFVGQTISLAMWLWVIHVLFQMNFIVNDPEGAAIRVLSAFEFLYFYSVSYVTLGYGDIVPHSYGARCILLIINCYTIISLVYWYSVIAKGPRQSIIKAHFKKIYRKHLNRIEEKRSWLKTGIKFLEALDMGSQPFCPNFLDKNHKDIKCSLCNGTNHVGKEVFFAYAILKNYGFKTMVSKMVGMSKAQYNKFLSGSGKN
jgi:hypothetical protein